MARSKTLISLLLGFALLAAMSCAFAEVGGTLARVPGDPNVAKPLAMGTQLNPIFKAAAKKYNVPLDLLLTLGWFGSNFENRGDAPTIEGGYGIMALRDNILGSDTLVLGASLVGASPETTKTDPKANINAAAAVLSSFANAAGINRDGGIDAWLHPVISYAGLDEENSRLFAMEVFQKLQRGFEHVNSQGEGFGFSAQSIGSVDLKSLEPGAAVAGTMSAQYGPAVWDAAATCNYTATSTSKDTIVIHTIEGTAAGCRSWFKNCNSSVSAHYVTSEGGGVWQCVDEWYRAWHAGCVNSRAIGIENEGYAGSPSHPQLLYDTVGLLCRDICDSWGIQKAHNGCPPGICGHVDVNNCVCGGTHWDPGGGWDWGYMISVVNGATYYNPPYLFGGGNDYWTPGNSTSAIWWTGADWNGSMYFDQTGNDAYVHSPATNFGGVWGPQTVNVDFYAQNGNTAAHDLQLFWKTNGENFWDAPKSTPVVNYNAQNSWATVNLYINNAKWWGQTINQLRLDFDQVNHGNRWIVNHFVLQNALWWHYDNAGDVMGWYAGNALTAPWQTSGGWPGILVTDQTANDAILLSPSLSGSGFPYNYLGGVNDWIHVRVFPQNGSTNVHDMALYWITSADGTWSESKSTHVTYVAQDAWADVYLPVGRNATWPAGHITQLRLDFDQTNHGNRWIVDYILSEHDGFDTTAPSVPTGLGGTATSQTQINLTWAASSDAKGVNGYKVYRNDVQIGTSVAPSYSDTGLSANTTYTYKVSAYDGSGNTSAQTAGVPVTTQGGDTTPPSVPTGLSATAISSTQVNCSWTASTDNVGVTGYKVFRGGVQIGTSATTTYSDTTCSAGQTYSYTVSAYDAASNNSAQSTAAVVTTPDTIAPTAPTGLVATAISRTQCNLAWTASTDNVGVTGYKVFRNAAQIGTSATTSYSDTTCSPNTTYTYTVSAYDAAGNNSGLSNQSVATTPYATDIVVDNPAATYVGSWFTGTATTDKYGADYRYITTQATETATATFRPTMDISAIYTIYGWWPQGSNRSVAAPYTVYWDGGSQTVTANQTAGGGAWNTLLTNKRFLAGTAGYVKLGNGTGEVSKSVMADAVRFLLVSTDISAPTVPTNLVATPVSSSQINLTWTASTDNVGVTGYRIFRDGVEIGTSATTSYSSTGLAGGTLYTYKVAAYDAMGNQSAQSAQASATTLDGIPPTVPTGLTATAVGPQRINLSWTASTDNVGVTGYKVFRGGVQIGTSATTSYSDGGRSPGTAYTYTVSAYDAAQNNSAQSTSAGATTPGYQEAIVDNPACTFTGAWTVQTTSADKYLTNYHYASTAVSETKTAVWRPSISYAGNFDTYIWYPQGSNRATNAPFTLYWDGGSQAVAWNQSTNGGAWRSLLTGKHFAGPGRAPTSSSETAPARRVRSSSPMARDSSRSAATDRLSDR